MSVLLGYDQHRPPFFGFQIRIWKGNTYQIAGPTAHSRYHLRKLKKLVEEKRWHQWKFYIVAKDKSARDDTFYHHIIDASSTGKTVWQDMMRAAVNHLLNQSSQSS